MSLRKTSSDSVYFAFDVDDAQYIMQIGKRMVVNYPAAIHPFLNDSARGNPPKGLTIFLKKLWSDNKQVQLRPQSISDTYFKYFKDHHYKLVFKEIARLLDSGVSLKREEQLNPKRFREDYNGRKQRVLSGANKVSKK